MEESKKDRLLHLTQGLFKQDQATSKFRLPHEMEAHKVEIKDRRMLICKAYSKHNSYYFKNKEQQKETDSSTKEGEETLNQTLDGMAKK